MSFVNYIIDNDLGIVETGRSFSELTTIGCGGVIKHLYTPNSIDSLCLVYKYLNENQIKFFILGNGSNVLASDDYFEGVVINLRKMSYSYKLEGDILNCSSFYPTSKLAYDLAKQKLGDLSFLGGIPGLLGGAIYNNSGAYNDKISNHIIDVTYINQEGKIITLRNEECNFGYRKSIFHHLGGLIISCRLKINYVDTSKLLKERLLNRKETQPLESKNCGSIFKNNKLISAWKVVDALGMRGFHINDAAVSAKHSNFIINLGNAKSADVNALIRLIQKRALLEFGIILTSEITIL